MEADATHRLFLALPFLALNGGLILATLLERRFAPDPCRRERAWRAGAILATLLNALLWHALGMPRPALPAAGALAAAALSALAATGLALGFAAFLHPIRETGYRRLSLRSAPGEAERP